MDLFDKFLQENEKGQLKDVRLKEQQDKQDYSFEEDGSIEICDNCKSSINSHGHCPLCDY